MTYHETLRPPWWLYGLVIALAALFGFTFVAVSNGVAGVIAFVVLAAVGCFLVNRRALRITVDADWLVVGDKRVPRADIRQATSLDAQQRRDVAGPDSDARAVLVLRGLATSEGVRVDMAHGDIPYWLISSQHPQELAAALNA